MTAFGQSETKQYKDRILRIAANKVTTVKKMGYNPKTYFGKGLTNKNTGGMSGALKEAEGIVRRQAASEGRPMYPTDVKTKKQLSKYVKKGLREKNLEQATERSAAQAVFQKAINRFMGVEESKGPKLDESLKKTRNQIKSVSKLSGASAAYVVGRLLTPTKVADATLDKGFKYKEFKRK